MSRVLKECIISAFICIVCFVAAIYGNEESSTKDGKLENEALETEEEQRLLNNIVEGAMNMANAVSRAADTAKGVADMVKGVLGQSEDDSDEKSPLQMMGPLLSLLS